MAKWPFVGGEMKQAPRGQGNLGTSGGGKPEKKAMPYDHPRSRSGKTDTNPGNGTVHCVQGKH